MSNGRGGELTKFAKRISRSPTAAAAGRCTIWSRVCFWNISKPFARKARGPGRFRFRRRAKKLAFTTDSYVVDPIFFPGGDIGDLAIHGTVNDLAMSGARPFIFLPGLFSKRVFRSRIYANSGLDAEGRARGNVQIVTGDTKVVQKGGADKIFINTAGVGVIEAER